MRERGGFIRPEWWDRRAREGSIRALEAGVLTARGRERILTTEKVIHDFFSDQRGSISPILLATLPPAAALMLFIGIACGQQAISSPPEIPTSAPIARPTETPTPSSTAIAEAQKPTPIPTPTEVSPLDAIFDYTVCTGKFSDPETGRTGSILITFIPASGMKHGVTSAIAFFVSSRNERDQIDEQQYVIYTQNVDGNTVQGTRGLWEVTATFDPITKQVEGNIGGPPGDYDFQSRCKDKDNGKTAFSAALKTIRPSIDTTKVFNEFNTFGIDLSKWPS